MATAEEIQRLDEIRSRHRGASTDWHLTFGRNREEQISARLVPNVPPTPVVILSEECDLQDRDFLLMAHADIDFLLQMMSRAAQKIRQLETPPRDPKNFAAECAIKCQNDGAFKRYLMECHQLHDAGDAERVKTRVRSILAITSMAELNTDPVAGARWEKLRNDFKAWMGAA